MIKIKVRQWEIYCEDKFRYTFYRNNDRYDTPIVQLTYELSLPLMSMDNPVVGYYYDVLSRRDRLKRRIFFDTIEEGMHYFDVLLHDKGMFDIDKIFEHKDVLKIYYKNTHS